MHLNPTMMAGVSLTHGYPRQHIWTFAAEDRPTVIDACPCDARINIRIPPFVGEDYFCGTEMGTLQAQLTTVNHILAPHR